MKLYRFILLLILLFIINACQNSNSETLPAVESSKLDNFNFIRFDQEVFDMSGKVIPTAYDQLKQKHSVFTDLYFAQLLRMKANRPDTFFTEIENMLTADAIITLQLKIDKVFKNDKALRNSLMNACKYLKHYFPNKTIPNFYTMMTEFGYQTILFQDNKTDGIGIGLDFFLGDNFDYKSIDPKNPVFSQYLTRTYNKDHITRKAMDLIVDDMMGPPPTQRMIDQMIHSGKRMYILDKLLPSEPDSIVFEFSQKQIDWLYNNEIQMWDFFLEKELFYETSHLKINKYLNPSPNSPGMPPEAPGKTAVFMGYQIIKAFMDKHPDMSMTDLINLKDSQLLMEKAKYRPKRR